MSLKNFLLRPAAVFLAALLALPTLAQQSPSEKSAHSAAGATLAQPEVYWTTGTTYELTEARAELEALQKRYADTHPQVVEQRAKIEKLQKLAPQLLNLNFPGGSLETLIAALHGPDNGSFNVIATGQPTGFSIDLPSFSLRNANWVTVGTVLDHFLGPRGYRLAFVSGDTESPEKARSVVYTLDRLAPPGELNRAPELEFESFQLADKIYGDQTIESIVDAIRAAWELEPSHAASALRIKFHPPTGDSRPRDRPANCPRTIGRWDR